MAALSFLAPISLGNNQQCYQREPEQAIRYEGNRAEGIALFLFHDTGDNLCNASIKYAHA